MERVFEVGKEYYPYDACFDPITVIRRTEKTIWVQNKYRDESKWMMRIKKDIHGNEFATDSTVPMKWRTAFTYQA